MIPRWVSFILDSISFFSNLAPPPTLYAMLTQLLLDNNSVVEDKKLSRLDANENWWDLPLIATNDEIYIIFLISTGHLCLFESEKVLYLILSLWSAHR